MSSLQEQLASRFEQDLSDLIEFLRIPSVSALREHRADMHRAAEWLAAAMRRWDVENVQVIETPGHPIVYADWIRDPTSLRR